MSRKIKSCLTFSLFFILFLPAFSQSPTIETIIPNWGPPAGGTDFVVKGTNFKSGAKVLINGIECTTIFVDPETLNATSPNMGTYGIYQVRVNNPDGKYAYRNSAFSAIQKVYYIAEPPRGNDSNNGTSPSTPKASIQKLIDEKMGGSNPPDDGPIEIRLEQGTYKENLWLRRRIILTGGWSTNFTSRDPDQYITILDGDYDDMCARSWGFAATITMDGITMINGRRIQYGGAYYSLDDYSTITNNVIAGNRAEMNGGAIYMTFNNDMYNTIISSNIIVGNRADYHNGGGIGIFPYGTYPYSFIPDAAISSNYIVGNKARRGGGIWIYPDFNEYDRVKIKHNLIVKNKAEGGKGGGILLADETTINLIADVKNNLIRNNEAKSYGGGLLVDGNGEGSFTITQNTIAGNSASWFGDGIAVYDTNTSTFSVRNSILYFNNGDDVYNGPGTISITYSDVQEGFTGSGNISSDPLFASGPLGKHYLSQAATGEQDVNSPCLDSGSGTASDQVMDSLTTRTDEVGDSGTVDMGYHFKSSGIPTDAATPNVSSIIPSGVNFRGGDWVVIRGSGFREGVRVFIDNVESSDVILITEGKLLAEAPASTGGKRGLVNVEVRNSGGQSAVVTDGVRYADVIPPKWDTTVGIQSATDAKDCSLGIVLKWFGATDTDSSPVSYNIYRTTQDPFDTTSDYRFIPTKKAYPSDPGGYRPATYLTNVPDLTYLDTNVSKSVQYWYIVEAIDSADKYGETPNRELNSVISTESGTIPTTNSSDTTPPEPVGNTLKVTKGTGDKIHLDWMASAGAFKYNIYRSTDKTNVGNASNRITTITNGYTTEYDDTPPSGDMFFYKIKATDSCNPSGNPPGNEANE
ncbi:MAG: IPT/TIG domain-containing protein [Acidobacteriota bacterium]